MLEKDQHNHDKSEDLSAYASVRKLTTAHRETIRQMSKAGSLPRVILASLRQQDPTAIITAQDVYNAKKAMRAEDLGGRHPIEVLLDELQEQDIQHDLQRSSTGHITHLFFVPKKDVAHAHEFPYVIILADCTYKTNKFKMPLLHVVGMTSTNQSFSICFAYMSGETQTDYQWALLRVKTMYGDTLPLVVVTDRELALMNAIAQTLPSIINLLCTWHIEKDVLAKTKKHFTTKEEFDLFFVQWQRVMWAPTEDVFEQERDTLHETYGKSHHAVVKYL